MIFAAQSLDEQIKLDQQIDLVAESIATIEVSVASLEKISRIGSKHGKKKKESQVLPDPSDAEGVVAHMNKIRATIRESLRQWQENLEKMRSCFAKDMTSNFVPAANAHVVHRGQGRSGSTGKSSAKKSSTTSGDSGGDGDGDGPKHSKKKKNRSSKVHKSSPQYPVSATVGTHQASATHSPSVPATNRGSPHTVIALVACLLFIIALVMLDEREVAISVISSAWIPMLIFNLTKSPKK